MRLRDIQGWLPGCIAIRMELISGSVMWRGVRDLEHSTLCRAFNLDPSTYFFDLPSSARGVGSNSSGYGGGGRNNRVINGYVMEGRRNEPYGKLTLIKESEKFRDVDPSDMREFYRLDR